MVRVLPHCHILGRGLCSLCLILMSGHQRALDAHPLNFAHAISNAFLVIWYSVVPLRCLSQDYPTYGAFIYLFRQQFHFPSLCWFLFCVFLISASHFYARMNRVAGRLLKWQVLTVSLINHFCGLLGIDQLQYLETFTRFKCPKKQMAK